jgi:hypothetical protein
LDDKSKTSNTRLDPTGNNAGLILAQAACPGGSAMSLNQQINKKEINYGRYYY